MGRGAGTYHVFFNPHRKDIITGDLRTIDRKLRRLLIRGPNCREPRRKNFSKAYLEIENSITKKATQNLLDATEEVTLGKSLYYSLLKEKLKK